MSGFEVLYSGKTFGGQFTKYQVVSPVLGHTVTKFNVFIPGGASQENKAPVLFYLAGSDSSEDQGPQKGGFFRDAAAEGIAIIFPDTSPRGAGIEGEDDDWKFGTGAGFYIDATAPKWSKHYNMYSFVTSELPEFLVELNLPLDFNRQSIFGQSTGGHGSLTFYLKALNSPKPYLSASALAPAANPTKSPWGHIAFNGYLQGGIEEGKAHDATELVAKVNGKLNILIDYGEKDKFHAEGQLLTDNFLAAARKAGHGPSEVQVRAQEGYDHGYYFISTFASDHIKFHSKFLNGK